MVRPYGVSDFDQLVKLYKNRAAYGGNYDSDRDEPERLKKTAEVGNLLVCEINGELVGSVMILDNPHTFWLLRFVADPESEMRDAAVKELDDAVSIIATERGHENIIVYTNPDDKVLLERYRLLGYTESTDYKCFWKEARS